MLQFSAPTDNAVKAVIIEKNHARGKRIFYYCLCSFGITLIYALLSFLLKDWSGVGAFFSDWGLSSLIYLTVLGVFFGLVITFRPVLKKEVYNNGHYSIDIDPRGIKIVFEEGTEIFVPKSKVCSVTESIDYFVIYCFNNKDEIVCQKDKITQGTIEQFYDIFSTDYGVSRVKKLKPSRFARFLFDGKKPYALYAVVFSLLACLLVFPTLWFSLKVSTVVVPQYLWNVMGVTKGLELYLQIIIGLILLPFGIICTILSGVGALIILLLPLFCLLCAITFLVKQVKKDKNWLSAICVLLLIACVIVAVYGVFSVIWHL